MKRSTALAIGGGVVGGVIAYAISPVSGWGMFLLGTFLGGVTGWMVLLAVETGKHPRYQQSEPRHRQRYDN